MGRANNFIDLSGQKIGMLTIVSRNTDKRTSEAVHWNCICVCGNSTITITSHLRSGHTKSCGCLIKKENRKNRIDEKYGMLTVISFNCKEKNKVRWNCKCLCGNTTVVSASNLASGAVKSCGCLKKASHNVKHGQSNKRIGHIWDNMKARCCREGSQAYANYGGRGITICNEWLENSSNFYEWAFSHGYNDSLTIERINVNGNYEPSNCVWAKWSTQARNKRNTLGQEVANKIRLEVKAGEKINDLATKYGVHKETIRNIITGRSYFDIIMP